MFWMLPALAQAPMPPPASQSLQVVFDDIPDERRRRKMINWALRKSKTLQGGRNWGRALCFNFHGEPDEAIIRRALGKFDLAGEIREAEGCDRPPMEAFLPPPAAFSRIVDLVEVPDVLAVRGQFSELLEQNLGITAVRIDDAMPTRMCLEFTEAPDDTLVQTAVGTLPVVVQEYAETPDCVTAFAGAE